MKNLPSIHIICGPTATGKTETSIALAQKIGGEIVSADSRQVYRGLDIGTAKITVEEMQGVPHHMIDIADPHDVYTVAQYQKQGHQCIDDILARGKVPIVVGGSGFYIEALIYENALPAVPPNNQLRTELGALPIESLQAQLKSRDPSAYQRIDSHNKQRIIRALEIYNSLGDIPEKSEREEKYTITWHYKDCDDKTLKQRIAHRNMVRIDNGLIDEVQGLIDTGISYERLDQLGLEYRYVSQFIVGDISSKDELIEILNTKTWQFAKRQRTWFKKYLPEGVYKSIK